MKTGLLGLLAALLFLGAVRDLWAPVGLEDSDVQRALFESDGPGDVHVALTQPERFMVPNLSIDGDVLRIPPGYAVALPLDQPATVRGQGRAPWFAVGDTSREGVARLRQARTLDGQGQDREWRPTAGWGEDMARLDALAQACGTELIVGGGQAQLGPCDTVLRGEVLVLAAGPSWLAVERDGFGEGRTVQPLVIVALLLSGLAAGLLAWGLGPPAGASTAAAVLLISLVSSAAGALGLVAAVGVGGLSAAARAWREGRRRTVYGALMAGVVAGVATPLIPSEPDPVVGGAACTLTGYSTAEGHGLRDDTPRPADRLREGCGACAAGTESLARGGERFDFVRDQLCGADGPVTGPVVFLGGGNDDLLWGLEAGGLVSLAARPLAQLRALSGSLSDPAASGRFYAEGAASTRATFDRQSEVLEEALACASRRGATLLYVQDFLAPDLEGGRAPDRAWMAARRQEILAAGGAGFLDLAEVYGDDAGVWTFSDFIHLSAPAHDRLVGAVCSQLDPRGSLGNPPD